MHLDVQDLRNFYYRSTLGRAAQRILQNRLVELWPDVKGQTVAGFGFAVPMLRPFLADARRVIALMPGPQGVMPWPANMPNVSVLMEETAWPIETGHIDRLVVLHGLETSEQPSVVMDECWRTLGPGGTGGFHGAKPCRPVVTQRQRHLLALAGPIRWARSKTSCENTISQSSVTCRSCTRCRPCGDSG